MATILCIEDEDMLREDIAEELEDEGYEVFQAGDGHEGLQMIQLHKPDLVLCDITMPKKNGYQLLKEIRESYRIFDNMPFIFVSALADRERVIAGLSGGADAYITKPVDFELMQATVRSCLRQAKRMSGQDEEAEVVEL